MTGGPSAELTVRRVSGIDALGDDTAWIDAAGFYTSRRWTASQEGDRGFQTGYLTVVSGSGDVLAVAAYHCQDGGDSNPLYNERSILATDPGSQVLAGSRTGYDNRLLIHPQAPPAQRTRILALLTEALLDQARSVGAGHVAWWYLPQTAAAELAALPGYATARTSCLPSAQIDLTGTTFEDYVTGLRSRRRRVVRRDQRRLDEAGFTIRSGPAEAAAIERYAPLVVQVQRRHGEDLSVAGAVRYLHRCLGFGLGPDAVITEVADRDGRLVACCLGIAHQGVLNMRVYGCDYAAGYGHCGEYFGATVYGPVRYALATGLRAVHLGVTAYWAKSHRGATLRPREVVLVAGSAAELPTLAPDWGFLGEDAAYFSPPEAQTAPETQTVLETPQTQVVPC